MKHLTAIGLPVATMAVAFFFAASFRTEAANVTWTNTASGVWNTAANWDPNSVPGASDTAIITNAGVTVSLNGATTVGALILGTNGAGTVTLSLAGQTLSLNGPLTVNPSGSFTVDSGVLLGNANAVLSGTIGWVASFLAGNLTLASGSTLNVTTANNHDMPNCTLTNNGTVAWNNGTIRVGGSGTTIYNYGLWDAQSDQVLTSSGYGGTAVFNNYGTFRKSGGASEFANATLFQGVVFNQLAGVLDVQNGTNGLEVAFQGGGNFTGGYISTNKFGLTVLSIGNFNLNGTVTGTNTWQDTGNLVGTNVINGALTWVGGLWNNAASVTITPNTTLIVAGAGAGGSGYNDFAGTTVTNNGKVVWASGQIRGGGSGTTIYNYGLWDAQIDQYLTTSGYGGTTVFNNYGTLRKSGGASELANNTIFDTGVLFNQLAGVIDVQNSTNGLQLAFLGGGNFTGGYVTTNTQGLLNLAQGSFNLNGTVTGTNTWQTGGTLVGTNVINGGFTWVGGVWNGAVVTIAPNCTVVVVGGNGYGSGYNDMGSAVVTNNGTVAWVNGTIRGGSGTAVYNYGLWDARSDQQLSAGLGGSSVFNNYGILRKSGGASELANNTVFSSGVVFNQLAGVIDVQNGTNGLQLNFQGGGNFTGGYITTNASGLTVLGAGNFTVNGTVTGTNTWQDIGSLVGNNVIQGALTWVGGVWNGAAVTIAPNSTVIVAGGGGNNDMNAAVVTNYGTLAWSSGTLRGGSGTAVYNYGLWDAQSDQTFNDVFGGSTVFNNLGTFRKSGGINPAINTLFGGGVLFNQSSGILDVRTGNVVLQGGGNFIGGFSTTNSTGTTYLSSGGFNINGTVTSSNVVENAGNLVGTNVINGALTWVAGVWSGAVVTIAPNSTVIVAGGGGVNDMNAATVTNYGTLAWSSGTLRGGNGASVYNYGLWNAQSDQQFNSAYGGATIFNNFGTVRKSAGVGNTFFTGGVLFNQTSGLLSAQTGNLLLQGGGNFTGGSISNSNFGTIYLNAGGFNINGTATSGNVIENAGNLVGTNVINGTLNWVAGNWNNAVVTITTNSTVIVAGGGGVNDMASSIVTNNGTVTWASGQIRGGSGTAIYNYGLWDAQSDQQLNNAYGGATVFNNFGTFRKELTSGTTSIAGGVTFNNTGKMDAQDGNIALQGAYTLANGTQMGFGLGGWMGNGSISLSGSASFSGSLSVNINGYFWPAVGGSFNLLNYTSESGVLFTNTVLAAPFTWQTNYNATAFAVTVVTRPAFTNTASTNLFVLKLNQTTLYLAWPGDHTGWTLQSQTNPITVGLSSNWVAVSGSPQTNEVFIPIATANGAVFFRMTYP